MKQLDTVIQIFNSLIAANESGACKILMKKDSQLSMQIIPNVARIKLEKIKVAKELLAQQENKEVSMSMSIDLNQSYDFDQLSKLKTFNYYFENVFTCEDYYLYRAICYFYKKEYSKAVSDYEICKKIKSKNETIILPPN